jgi:phosphate transport system substrate-binding protein
MPLLQGGMEMFARRVSIFCVVVGILFLPVHRDETQAAEQPIVISSHLGNRLLLTGSSTMCPLIAEVGRRFQELHHDVHVEVQCGGSERGIRDIREGKSDIGMASRPLHASEQDLYSFPMARDGVSVIESKKNPVEALSNAQVAAIFTGKIRNWKEVGGRNAPISVVLREKQKSSTELFMRYYQLKETDIRGRVIAGDNPVTIRAVASNRNSIGYVSSGQSERVAASGVPIKILPVNNVMPTRRNIITGNYPISRPLSLVTKGIPSGLVKKFIDFSLSSSVVDLIVKFDFVPYED